MYASFCAPFQSPTRRSFGLSPCSWGGTRLVVTDQHVYGLYHAPAALQDHAGWKGDSGSLGRLTARSLVGSTLR